MQNLNEIWMTALDRLSVALPQAKFDSWIKPLSPLCIIKNKMILVSPSATAPTIINKHYLDQIRAALSEAHDGGPGELTVTDAEIMTEDQKNEYLEAVGSAGTLPDDEKNEAREDITHSSSFINKYTFDNLADGLFNREAYAAAKRIAETPGKTFNPLFIYSEVGHGKTHTLHAIGNHIISRIETNTRKKRAQLRIINVTSENFVAEYIETIRDKTGKTGKDFREKYRSADVLIMDDIQFLAGKAGTQEVLFNIFNELIVKNSQIIMTADKDPRDIDLLESRLSSRFVSGLTIKISRPTQEDCFLVLKKIAQREKYSVTDEILKYVVSRASSSPKADLNFRDMERLLHKIVFFASLHSRQRADDLALAEEALKDCAEEKRESVNADDVIKAVCEHFKISKEDLAGKKKNKEIVEPRQIAVYLMTELLSIPLISIGKVLGGRDHATVIHARDKISERIKTDQVMKANISDIKNYIKEIK